MLKHLRRAGGRCAAVLLAGLCLHAGASALHAQPGTIPADRTVQPAAPPSLQGEGPKPFWATVPDLQAPALPGLFLLPPTGPGYYTGLDALHGDCKDKAPFYPYRGVFYDNDFRYLDAKDGKPYDCFDDLKRIHLGSLFDPSGDDWLLSVGGEERIQIKNEVDSRLTTTDNNYQLLRSRVYGDLWYRDLFRVYVEFLDARSYNENLPPLAVDVDKADLLDAFVDVKLAEIGNDPVYARVGRQELQYGSQRLISTLDWANTRRTFEGGKVFYRSEKLDLDAFLVRPVIVSPSHFDYADVNRPFAGFWATYRPAKGRTIDAYYLYLDSDSRVPASAGAVPGGRGGYDVNTVGGRYNGFQAVPGRCCGSSPGSVLWDFEDSYQFGAYTDRDLSAAMSSSGVGWELSRLPMQPQFWVYYDFASGTPNLGGTGEFDTFNQLFPFGHYYLGFDDLVGRENINDLNFQGAIYPAKWITAIAQYHMFRLDQAQDALYGVSPGYPIERRSASGAAGRDVGDELDFTLSFQLDRHSNLQFGYSKFLRGSFIDATGAAVSPELLYCQYQFRW